MKKLFEPVRLRNLQLKNRLVRSATWEALAAPDGSIDDRTYAIYRELAQGGVGAVITGFTSVSLNDYYFNGMMRLSNDALIPQYGALSPCARSVTAGSPRRETELFRHWSVRRCGSRYSTI